MDRKTNFSIGYLLAAFLIMGLFQLWLAYRNTAVVTYAELMRAVSEGKVQSVTLTETMIEGRYKNPVDGKAVLRHTPRRSPHCRIFREAGRGG